MCLFFDAFPFESGEGFEEDEVVRNKQWAIMLAALMDPVPLVRTIAIQVSCSSMPQSNLFLNVWLNVGYLPNFNGILGVGSS